jgi:hypothetical protein
MMQLDAKPCTGNICWAADLATERYARDLEGLVDNQRALGVHCGLAVRDHLSAEQAVDFIVISQAGRHPSGGGRTNGRHPGPRVGDQARQGATELRTLAACVEALGGRLEIIADFGDQRRFHRTRHRGSLTTLPHAAAVSPASRRRSAAR